MEGKGQQFSGLTTNHPETLGERLRFEEGFGVKNLQLLIQNTFSIAYSKME